MNAVAFKMIPLLYSSWIAQVSATYSKRVLYKTDRTENTGPDRTFSWTGLDRTELMVGPTHPYKTCKCTISTKFLPVYKEQCMKRKGSDWKKITFL